MPTLTLPLPLASVPEVSDSPFLAPILSEHGGLPLPLTYKVFQQTLHFLRAVHNNHRADTDEHKAATGYLWAVIEEFLVNMDTIAATGYNIFTSATPITSYARNVTTPRPLSGKAEGSQSTTPKWEDYPFSSGTEDPDVPNNSHPVTCNEFLNLQNFVSILAAGRKFQNVNVPQPSPQGPRVAFDNSEDAYIDVHSAVEIEERSEGLQAKLDFVNTRIDVLCDTVALNSDGLRHLRAQMNRDAQTARADTDQKIENLQNLLNSLLVAQEGDVSDNSWTITGTL